MKAIKLQGQITENHTLNIELPQDIHSGPVEVILLMPEEHNGDQAESSKEFLKRLSSSQHTRMSKQEIDDYLLEERNSWETDDAQNLS